MGTVTGNVSLGPLIDATRRDRIHALVTDSVGARARLLAGGTYEGLFYRPTVLADAGPGIPAYDQEVFGPVACVTRFSTLDFRSSLNRAVPGKIPLGSLGDIEVGIRQLIYLVENDRQSRGFDA